MPLTDTLNPRSWILDPQPYTHKLGPPSGTAPHQTAGCAGPRSHWPDDTLLQLCLQGALLALSTSATEGLSEGETWGLVCNNPSSLC